MTTDTRRAMVTPSGCKRAAARGGLLHGLARADLDLGRERAVHGAALGDLDQPRLLLFAERALQLDLTLDAVELALLGLAVRAVLGVDLRVLEAHRDGLQRPLLASRVQRERHRRSGAERGQQQVVGIGAGAVTAVLDGLVGHQLMWTDTDVRRQRS